MPFRVKRRRANEGLQNRSSAQGNIIDSLDLLKMAPSDSVRSKTKLINNFFSSVTSIFQIIGLCASVEAQGVKRSNEVAIAMSWKASLCRIHNFLQSSNRHHRSLFSQLADSESIRKIQWASSPPPSSPFPQSELRVFVPLGSSRDIITCYYSTWSIWNLLILNYFLAYLALL